MTALALLLIGSLVGPANASFGATAYRIANWEPDFMNSAATVTKAEAVAEAKTFDVIVGLKDTYRPYVSAMRAANANLILLVYLGGGFSMGDPLGTAYPDAWYSHDGSGRKVKLSAFGNFLMNPAKSGWVDDVATRCANYRVYSGYNGCLLDQLGPAALNPAYVTGLPINPSTGKVWTRAAWLKATSALATSVKRRLGRYYVIPNGVLTGSDYSDPTGPTKLLTTNTDGGMVELFSRAPYTPLSQYRPLKDWKKDVDMLVDAGRNSRTLLVVTKAWASGTQAQKDALHEYALGTFLLGTNGRSYFSFLYSKKTQQSSSFWTANIGSPTSAYSLVGGVYQRHFTKGLVLVNPTTSAYTVKVGSGYRTLSGISVTSIRLSSHHAAILTKP